MQLVTCVGDAALGYSVLALVNAIGLAALFATACGKPMRRTLHQALGSIVIGNVCLFVFLVAASKVLSAQL